MKKILGIMMVTLLSNQLTAQTSAPTSGAKMLSTAESKKQNANTETTINGIPYSQYKAQQDALKIKQEQAVPAPAPKLKAVTGNPEELKAVSPAQKAATTAPAAKTGETTSSAPVAKTAITQQGSGN
jgi:hypothetical protein